MSGKAIANLLSEMRLAALSLSRTFALLSLVTIALITAGQVTIQWALLKEDLLALERTATADTIRAEVYPRIRAEDFERWTEPGVRERFDEVFRRILSQREILRVKVYDSAMRVVWSDEPRLLGTRFPENAHLAEALRGQIVAHLERALKAENLYERQFGQSVELYMPLVFQAGAPGKTRVTGVVEVYKSPAQALANLSRDRWTIVGASLIGALLLYTVLFGIVHRASRLLLAQRENLEHRTAALTAANQELRAMQDQLRVSERLAAVGEVSAAVAHGIRNPLANIRATAQVALDQVGDRVAIEGFLGTITAEVDRLGRWLWDLLQFVRPFELRLKPVDLNAVIEDLLRLLDDRIARGEVKVERHLAGDLPVLQADEVQLQQAFLGVFENAVDALASGGLLVIKTEAASGAAPPAVRVTVRDGGAGISSERLV